MDNGGKAILLIKWLRTELGSCSSVLWRVQLMNNEIGYLAEEISKKTVEDVVFLLLIIAKGKEREIT